MSSVVQPFSPETVNSRLKSREIPGRARNQNVPLLESLRFVGIPIGMVECPWEYWSLERLMRRSKLASNDGRIFKTGSYALERCNCVARDGARGTSLSNLQIHP